ncbi:MAG: DegT/DnrJ/EryC1/StrS family aminotransferase [Nanoarchaeota archaeon]
MIPFVDLKRGHEKIKEEINEAIERVVYNQSSFILGKEGEFFEREFAGFCGKNYAVGVNSGTDALELALIASGVKKGDEVILPSNTAIPTAMAISSIGAVPVFADINEDFLINPSDLEKKITEKTRAIIPVHLYGLACDMQKINDIAKGNNLSVIEDCCQAHGAEYRGKRVPISEIGCFSFYPSKNLGALGDGGMVVTSRKDISNKLKLLRNYGQRDKYHASILGRNSRLDEIQAAILGVKLKYLDEWNSKRRENALIYDSELSNVVKIPEGHDNRKHVYHLYVIRTENRDGLMKHLRENEIGHLIHYPKPLHLQEAFSYLGYKEGDFPNAERYSKEIISLPMFPELTREEIIQVSKKIKEFTEMS